MKKHDSFSFFGEKPVRTQCSTTCEFLKQNILQPFDFEEFLPRFRVSIEQSAKKQTFNENIISKITFCLRLYRKNVTFCISLLLSKSWIVTSNSLRCRILFKKTIDRVIFCDKTYTTCHKRKIVLFKCDTLWNDNIPKDRFLNKTSYHVSTEFIPWNYPFSIFWFFSRKHTSDAFFESRFSIKTFRFCLVSNWKFF